MNFNNILKKYNFTQTQVAKILNVNQNTISQWVNKKRKIKIDTLHKLAEALGITLQELLLITEEDNSNQSAIQYDISNIIFGSKEEFYKMLGLTVTEIKNLQFILIEKKTYLEPVISSGNWLIVKQSSEPEFNNYHIVEYKGKQFICLIYFKNNKFVLKTNNTEIVLKRNEFVTLAVVKAVLHSL